MLISWTAMLIFTDTRTSPNAVMAYGRRMRNNGLARHIGDNSINGIPLHGYPLC